MLTLAAVLSSVALLAAEPGNRPPWLRVLAPAGYN
jgi:hypothetical protein